MCFFFHAKKHFFKRVTSLLFFQLSLACTKINMYNFLLRCISSCHASAQKGRIAPPSVTT